MKSLVTVVMTGLFLTSLSVQANEEVSVKQAVENMMQQNAVQLNKQMQQENRQAIKKNLLSVQELSKANELLVQTGYFSGAKNNVQVNAK
ncbi:hypothetical protein [Thalassomonas actiniarum]|uniref:Uncharacterized protein n=1 Tax=Thalassomonas actiniarum TaxID=485447 RepID=A0AAF0C359_9GAMM|nr:hypothetical protein [Thalassomonas actiniarum]WDD98334.1 hypothetical protein SG35_024175 [Thalassomonas actiniarum]